MEIQLMTREVVKGLDILCASYAPPTNMPKVTKIDVITESHTPKILEEHTNLHDFELLGIDLQGTIAPYVSRGQPVVEDGIIKAMRFWNRNNGLMRFLNPDVWASQIGAKDGFVYFGGHEDTTLLMFEKPISFDPSKDFLYVRSPNEKFTPQNVLAAGRLVEDLTLGEWMVIEEDGKEKAVDYHLVSDLYCQGKFKSLIRIYDSVDGITLKHEEGGEPIMKKNPDGTSWSQIGKGFRPVRKFSLPDDISTFSPLAFNPSQYPEIKGQSPEVYPEEKLSRKTYSLVYINPAEITSLRWGFNSSIMEPMSGGVSRYHNQHLF